MINQFYSSQNDDLPIASRTTMMRIEFQSSFYESEIDTDLSKGKGTFFKKRHNQQVSLFGKQLHVLPTTYIQSSVVTGKAVLELGAGLGLCGMVAHHLGAKLVDLTDVTKQ